MAVFLWMTIFCFAALDSSAASLGLSHPADILEVSPIIWVGANLTLHCVIDLTATNFTATDIQWVKDYGDHVDNHVWSVYNSSVAQMHIVNATTEDSGAYFCRFPDEPAYHQYLSTGTTVHVGSAPVPVVNLDCFSTNVVDFTCTWDDGRDYNIQTNDVMYLENTYQEEELTRKCVPVGKANECVVSHGSATAIKVVSSNHLGNATAWLARRFSPDDEVRPNAPTNVQGSSTEERKIAVTWERPADWTAIASYGLFYQLEYRKEGVEEWTRIPSTSIAALTHYTISSLDPYIMYYVRVSAAYDTLVQHFQSDVFGTWSDPIEVYTLAEEPAAVLRNLVKRTEYSTNDYQRAVTLEWDAIPESEYWGPGFGYNVTVVDDDYNVIQVELTTNTLAHLEGLDKFERLTIQVTPYNDVGAGTNVAEMVLQDATSVPGSPENIVAVSITSSSVRLQWDPPSTITGHITGYVLDWGTGNAEVSESNHSYEITGLDPNTEYMIQVQTENKRGLSGHAFVPVETSDAAPSAPPQFLQLSALPLAPSQLMVTWETVAPDHQNGEVLLYTIQYCRLGDSSGAQQTVPLTMESICSDGKLQLVNVSVSDSAPLSHTLTGLEPYTDYVAWISASTQAGQSPISRRQEERTSQGSPSAPLNLEELSMNASSVELAWDAPMRLNGKLLHYVIAFNGKSQAVETESATIEVNGFTNYSFKVQACSQGEPSVSCGPYSEVIYVKTDIGVPLEVSAVAVSSSKPEEALMTWERPLVPNGPISYYMIRYRPENSELNWAYERSERTEALVTVDCNVVDEKTLFDFQVYAVNDVGGERLIGPAVDPIQYEMCNIHKVPVATIVLAVLLPSAVVFLVAIFLLWIKQSEFFKPPPEPYFIEPVRDQSFQMKGPLLVRTEPEKFDRLRQADSTTNLLQPPYDRLSSKESSSTSSSTDQGIHDMDGCPEELRYVRDKTSSRSQSEGSEEDRPQAPPNSKHSMRIMSDDYDEEDQVFGATGGDGSVTYSRIAEVDGADCSTPMLGKGSTQYLSDGSEGYSQLSQVPFSQSGATPPAAVRGLSDQRSEASFGSQSTVNYHRLGMSGLTPITSEETLPSEDPLVYARLSQGSEADIEYSQLAQASSNQSLTGEGAPRVPSASVPPQPPQQQPQQEGKGVAMSLPSVSAASRIQPQQELIVATALAPGSHPNPASSQPSPQDSGYVTSPPTTLPAKPPAPDADTYSRKHLADSKSQSGSDSSLTDGEGYSTLGLADSPSGSAPHHQAQSKVSKPCKTTPEPSMPSCNGYVPNNIMPPSTTQSPTRSPAMVPAPMPAATGAGYVTESDMKAMSQPLPGGQEPSRDNQASPLRVGVAAPAANHIPNGLPCVGDNGYVASQDLPAMMASSPHRGQCTAPPVTGSASPPYITPEQMAQIPSNQPPSPTTPLNNNHPLPLGKKFSPDDPYVRIGAEANIAAFKPNDFSVC